VGATQDCLLELCILSVEEFLLFFMQQSWNCCQPYPTSEGVLCFLKVLSLPPFLTVLKLLLLQKRKSYVAAFLRNDLILMQHLPITGLSIKLGFM